jgi:hypothetical protein
MSDQDFVNLIFDLFKTVEPILTIAVMLFALWFLIALIRGLLDVLRDHLERGPLEPRPRARVRLRRRKSPPRLRLNDLSLIIRQRQDPKPYRRGRLLNPRQDGTMRPLAVIEVNDPDLVKRPLPVEFKLLDPKGVVKYECSFEHELAQGTNRIFPKDHEWLVRHRPLQGQWKLLIWIAGKWAKSQPIVVTTNPEILTQGSVSPDMELTAKDKGIAQQLEGLSIDDLMKS